MKTYTPHVSPHQGNGSIHLPAPTYPASTWHFIKGLTGNTTPAATLPFGKYACGNYNGAYPTGTGLNCANSGEPIRPLFDKPKSIGLAHFQHNGTGAIQVYYNYALTSPHYADQAPFQLRDILRETAHPGYYAVETEGITAEATTSELAVLHRYRFDEDGGRIAIDFANDGLYTDSMRGTAAGTVRLLSPNEVQAEMVLSGIKLWFHVQCDGTAVTLYNTDENLPGDRAELQPSEDKNRRFGVVFQASGREVRLKLAVSPIGPEEARAQCHGETRSFDEVRGAADTIWNEHLSKIEIKTEDPRELEIFYSNLYHTLTKPCALQNEAFLFDDKNGDMVFDLATMWDIYKTQLPFLFTFYPAISEKILTTLRRFGEQYGYFPHCLLLSGRLDIESKQARMLAEYAIVDGYLRHIPGDYPKLLDLAEQDAARFQDFFTDNCAFASHILDMSEAFTALALLARKLDKPDLAERYATYGKKVLSAFDEDGMMRKASPYYEGNRYNYSFRPLADMNARLNTFDKDKIIQTALRFFGYTEPDNFDARFEGFNNETDMEAPYFLHFIGQRDKLCQVIRSGLDSMFTTGIGGIPGNADSGGLTSCYLWNAIGLFPLSGQDKIIVVTPRYRRTVLHMPAADLVIEQVGDGMYTDEASLNGRKLDNFELKVDEMLQGGKLIVVTR